MTQEIEDLLGRMPLRRVPASLDDRVIGRYQRRRLLAWSLASGAVAAAAALVVAFAPVGRDGTPVARNTVPPPGQAAPDERVATNEPAKPVRLQRNWATVSYEGVVVPDNRGPMRQFRRRMLEQVEWIDPSRGTRMETTVPRDEIILVEAPVH